ncbi:ABC transporter ATP-binding protein [Asticcacaulis sp. SL142]|uniref:ABC transporter ATP-binding protein n=1 Tax=Asticcacaulis sp. SL142 TaxID=2995155 RepID=UPI00226CAC3A|nr:ABC transporter ATP-binding protein [Asticcacaulis sp. SL142]WAC47061.1 ABC transporter ATP-binding protein [Asticcacaulis sp. SL142]
MTIELRSVSCYLPIYSVSAKSLRRSAASLVGGSLFKTGRDVVSVRALENITLFAKDGDRIGLVGHNGAGKSTLLKVLAGVIAPTTGTVTVHGEISAALNTTLGLDMEISGRENILLLSYYRGIKREKVLDNIDEIVAAADLGHFIDLPVHTYSSGMLGRLTFAVATSFEPDVVLMDEWLLAGDINFLSRAVERTTDYVKKSRILVLASHSTNIIKSICNKAVYLKKGQIVAVGDPDEIIKMYETDPEVIGGHFVSQ